jgi:hypothetical protein
MACAIAPCSCTAGIVVAASVCGAGDAREYIGDHAGEPEARPSSGV